MDKVIKQYQCDFVTEVDVDSYTEPINASLKNILRALDPMSTGLSPIEFRWWVKLCKHYPDLDPMILNGLRTDILNSAKQEE